VAVVTISREEGSGGDSIAREVASKLGVTCVGRKVIEQAAESAGLPQEVLDAKEREATTAQTFASSDMVGLVRRSQAGKRVQLADALYAKYISEAVQQIAESPCVIVGRGSQLILQGCRDALHVHIYAPVSVRIARVMQAQGIGREQAQRQVVASDRERSSYIKKFFSNANWRSPDYYNLMIDTGKIAPEVACDLLVLAARSLDSGSFAPSK